MSFVTHFASYSTICFISRGGTPLCDEGWMDGWMDKVEPPNVLSDLNIYSDGLHVIHL